MSAEEHPVVLYWDASAVLSALFKDNHSREDLPELKLLTYDRRLWLAAQGEGLEIDPMP